jgi:hypothetical protein
MLPLAAKKKNEPLKKKEHFLPTLSPKCNARRLPSTS